MPAVASTDQKLKDDLKQVDEHLAAKRDERAQLAQAKEEAREKYAGSGLGPDSDEFKAAKEAVAAVGSCDSELAELTDQKVGILEMLGKDPASTLGAEFDRATQDPEADGNWNAAALLSDENLRAAVQHMSTSKAKVGPLQLGEVASADRLVADITGTTAMRRAPYGGVVPQLRRRLRVLDLIPTGTMEGNSLPYTQESGSFDTGTETAEGSAKPEAAVTYTDATADAQTIAHWLKVRKQALSDFPALQAMIDGRLRYGVLRRLEKQILSGDGSGANLRGILNTSGIGAVTFSSGAEIADQVLTGITTVFLADADATGIILHPTDWMNALKAKASGDGQYFSPGPFGVNPEILWGLPAVPNVGVAQGTALVGDFEIGVQLLIREGVNVLLSDSDQDDFIKNRVTLLAEMRAALPVWRPAAFATVALQ